MKTPRLNSPSTYKDHPARPADIDEEDEPYALAARRLLIVICLSLILVPVTFALLRLMGFHYDRNYPAAKKGFLRRHLGAEALETDLYFRAHHGGLKQHLHGHSDQSDANDGEGPILLSPVRPQVYPRYGVHEAKALNTRAAFRRDSLLINAIIGVSSLRTHRYFIHLVLTHSPASYLYPCSHQCRVYLTPCATSPQWP